MGIEQTKRIRRTNNFETATNYIANLEGSSTPSYKVLNDRKIQLLRNFFLQSPPETTGGSEAPRETHMRRLHATSLENIMIHNPTKSVVKKNHARKHTPLEVPRIIEGH